MQLKNIGNICVVFAFIIIFCATLHLVRKMLN